MRNIVSAGRMLDARERGLGGRGGQRQAVSAAFIAFSNRGPPKSERGHDLDLRGFCEGNSLYKPDVARSGPAALSLLVFPRPQGTKRAENFLPLFAAKGGLWPFCLSGSTAIAKIFSLRGFASGGPAGLSPATPGSMRSDAQARQRLFVYVKGSS